MSEQDAVSQSADRVVELVAAELRADKVGAAVRRFASASQHDPSLGRHDLVPWLAERIGKSLTQALVHGFAVYPCMGCKGGVLLCAQCQGRGTSSRGDPCEQCVSLGAASCDFCAGSGWITYNFVPQPLRPFVIMERTRIATSQACRILEMKNAGSPKAIAREIVQINRVLGALDNAMGAANEHLQSPHVKPQMWQKAIGSCAKAGIKLDQKIRAALKRMANAPAILRSGDKRRSVYLVELASSHNYIGTCLYHPQLSEIRRAAASKPRKSKS